MITQSEILIDYTDSEKIGQVLAKLTSSFDIDSLIRPYDYFSITEYKEYIKDLHFVKDDAQLIDVLTNIGFTYEIELNTCSMAVESDYLPALTDFIAQSLSLKLSCNTLSSFKPLNGDEFCFLTHFANGKHALNFALENEMLRKVKWIKGSL